MLSNMLSTYAGYLTKSQVWSGDNNNLIRGTAQWAQAHLQQSQCCSIFVLSNVSLQSNLAIGAGGAIYATSYQQFYVLCEPEGMLQNDKHSHAPCSACAG